jgi:hypothetical protein
MPLLDGPGADDAVRDEWVLIGELLSGLAGGEDQLFSGPAVGQFHHDVELADVTRVLLKQVE